MGVPRLARWLPIGLGVLFLTLLTQIGGLVLIAAWFVARPLRTRRGLATALASGLLLFAALHLGLSELALPAMAPVVAGRVRLPCPWFGAAAVEPATAFFCLANRNYVTPAARDAIAALGQALQARDPDAAALYLDAGFPFFDGFPLLPHLSHRHGTAVDLALIYRDAETGRPRWRWIRSPLGYWAFEQPPAGATTPCAENWPTLRWDMAWLQPLLPAAALDERATAAMLRWLVGPGRSHGVRRVLIEPHLEARLGIASDLLRFQGCRAARHDDHIHVDFDG
jgi:hypothetical protein